MSNHIISTPCEQPASCPIHPSNRKELASTYFVPLYTYGGIYLTPYVWLETVLFGILTMALTLLVYSNLRYGFRPSDKTSRDRLMLLGALAVLYSAFTVHWILSVKSTWIYLVQSTLDPYNLHVSSTFYYAYGPTVAECASFGIFCTLIALAVKVFSRKDMRSRRHRLMLVAVLLMYFTSLIHVASEIVLFQTGLATIISNWTIHMEMVPLVSLCINTLLSDAIILWRICVLCQPHRSVLVLAMLLLLPTFALTIVTLAEEATSYRMIHMDGGSEAIPRTSSASFGDLSYGMAILALSLTINVLSTSAIAWRTWRYRRDITMLLSTSRRRSIVEKCMFLLVKSGCVYSLFWVLYIVDSRIFSLESPEPVINPAHGQYLGQIMAQVTGIYPTVILVIVALGQSVLEKAITESRLSLSIVAHPPGQGLNADVSCRAAHTSATIESSLHSGRGHNRGSQRRRSGLLGGAMDVLMHSRVSADHGNGASKSGCALNAVDSEAPLTIRVEPRRSEQAGRPLVITPIGLPESIAIMLESVQSVPRLPTPDFGTPFMGDAYGHAFIPDEGQGSE